MPVEQMNISLPPKMARFIRSKVKSGTYTNASEVVLDAVRHMQKLDTGKQDRNARTAIGDPDGAAAEVREGYAAIRRGESTDIEGQQELKAYFDDVRGRAKKEVSLARNRRTRIRA